MLHMHERAGIDPPPRKLVGASLPRTRAQEFCLPAPDHPQSGLLGFRVSTPQPPIKGGFCFSPRGRHQTTAGRAQGQCANVFSRKATIRISAFSRADVRQPWNRRAFSSRLRKKEMGCSGRGALAGCSGGMLWPGALLSQKRLLWAWRGSGGVLWRMLWQGALPSRG